MGTNRFQMACISGNIAEAEAALELIDEQDRVGFLETKFPVLIGNGQLHPDILKHFLTYFPATDYAMPAKSLLLLACQKPGGELLIPILLDHFQAFKFEPSYEAQYHLDNSFAYIREALNAGRFDAVTALLQHPKTHELLKKSEFFFSVVIRAVVSAACREHDKSLLALDALLRLDGVEKVVVYKTTTKCLQNAYLTAHQSVSRFIQIPESVLHTMLQKIVSDSDFTLEDNYRFFVDAVKNKRPECANLLLLQVDPKDKSYRDYCMNIAIEHKDPVTMENILKKYPNDDFLSAGQMMVAFTIACQESPTLGQLLVQRKDKELDLECKTGMLAIAAQKPDVLLAKAVLATIEDPAERRTAQYDLMCSVARLGHPALMDVLPKIDPPLNQEEAEALLKIARESNALNQPPQAELQQQLDELQQLQEQLEQQLTQGLQPQEQQQPPQQLQQPQEAQQKPPEPQLLQEELQQNLQQLQEFQEQLQQKLQPPQQTIVKPTVEKSAITILTDLIKSDIWRTRHSAFKTNPENQKVPIGIEKLRARVTHYESTGDLSKFLTECQKVAHSRRGIFLSWLMKNRRNQDTDELYKLLSKCKTKADLEARKGALESLAESVQPDAQQEDPGIRKQ